MSKIAMQIASVRHARNLPAVKSNAGLAESLEHAERSLEFVRRNEAVIKALFIIEQKAPFLEDFLKAWPDMTISVTAKAVEEGLIDPELENEKE